MNLNLEVTGDGSSTSPQGLLQVAAAAFAAMSRAWKRADDDTEADEDLTVGGYRVRVLASRE